MGPVVTRLVATGAAAGAAAMARRAAEAGWLAARGEEPPTAAEVTDDRDLRDLLVWSAVVLGSVIVARRLAAGLTKRLLGSEER